MILKPAKVRRRYANDHRMFAQFGNYSSGNDIRIFHDGAALFSSVWREMERAKKTIYVEMYIIEMDGVGFTTLEYLARAQKRGVQCFLVYDYFGSANLRSTAYLQQLDALGVVTHGWNGIQNAKWHMTDDTPFFWSEIFRRTHRKIFLMDDDILFTGGMNLSIDYLPSNIDGFFQDTFLQLRGPIIDIIKRICARTFINEPVSSEIVAYLLFKQKKSDC